MNVTIKKLHPDAIVPAYAHGDAEDAGMDLYAVEDYNMPVRTGAAIPTGIAIVLPPYYEGQVRPRSGLALKHAVVANFGTIDPGYRGEIKVVMFNGGASTYQIKKGDRIAQLVVSRYERVTWVNGDLTPTKRGGTGFGKSGR